MRSAGALLLFVSATAVMLRPSPLVAEEDTSVAGLLELAVKDAEAGRCRDALAEVDLYLAKTTQPDARALAVLQKCPRNPQAPQPAQPPPAQPAQPPPAQPAQPPPAQPPPEPSPHAPAATKKQRTRRFLIDVEAGLNIPMTSDTLHVDFLGTLELGVALSNKIGLDLVLFAESLVSRAQLTPDSAALSTVYTANLLLGLEERRVVWRKLALFGTAAAGITVDSLQGFVKQGVLHIDVGVGWGLGPGELRLRPLGFSFLVGDGFGAAWRATAGYAFRF
jgi:hypothetical protein